MSVIATDAMIVSGRRREGSAIFVSSLVTNALGDGDAGRLFISTPTLMMDDGVLQALTLGNGRAGTIQLEVGSITLTGGAQISSSSGATDLSSGELAVGRGPRRGADHRARFYYDRWSRPGRGTERGVYGHLGQRSRWLAGPLRPRLHLEEGHIESATTGDGRAGDLLLTVGRLTRLAVPGSPVRAPTQTAVGRREYHDRSDRGGDHYGYDQ